MAIDTISSKIFFGYFAVVGAIFVATAGPDMVNDMVNFYHRLRLTFTVLYFVRVCFYFILVSH